MLKWWKKISGIQKKNRQELNEIFRDRARENQQTQFSFVIHYYRISGVNLIILQCKSVQVYTRNVAAFYVI